MIKQILVPTDGSDEAYCGVQYAVSLAERYKASILGIHVVDVRLLEGPFLRDISASLGTAPFVNYQNNISLILEERGKAALGTLQTLCEEAGVPVTTSLEVGAVSRCIAEKSELADLVIMGRTGEHGAWLEGVLGSTADAVIRRSAAPVLVTGTKLTDLKRCVVAYDGSNHGKKALQFGASIGETWGMAVEVLVVGDERLESLLEEAKGYLGTHDVTSDYLRRDGDPSEEIVGYATSSGADLIVMGGFGHSKVRELVVGSTVAYTLNHAPCPVLLTR